jgi:threonine dehydrogenase-like Zn-dependent dehydrogenase
MHATKSAPITTRDCTSAVDDPALSAGLQVVGHQLALGAGDHRDHAGVVVGGDGPEAAAELALLQRRGQAGRVVVIGREAERRAAAAGGASQELRARRRAG